MKAMSILKMLKKWLWRGKKRCK